VTKCQGPRATGLRYPFRRRARPPQRTCPPPLPKAIRTWAVACTSAGAIASTGRPTAGARCGSSGVWMPSWACGAAWTVTPPSAGTTGLWKGNATSQQDRSTASFCGPRDWFRRGLGLGRAWGRRVRATAVLDGHGRSCWCVRTQQPAGRSPCLCCSTHHGRRHDTRSSVIRGTHRIAHDVSS